MTQLSVQQTNGHDHPLGIYDPEQNAFTAVMCAGPKADEHAQLFAAAPDLLEALEWFVEFCDEHPEWTENELCNGTDSSAEAYWLQNARATIAKARGQS